MRLFLFCGIRGFHSLIDIVNEAERNESDLKSQFVDTVNDKTGSALPTDATWFDVKSAIKNMTNRKYKSGVHDLPGAADLSFKYPDGTVASYKAIEVEELGFDPNTC